MFMVSLFSHGSFCDDFSSIRQHAVTPQLFKTVLVVFRYREKLKVHALRVMALVEKTMHRLSNEIKAGQVNPGIRIFRN